MKILEATCVEKINLDQLLAHSLGRFLGREQIFGA
jgi:hypothetical protein